MNAEDDGVAYEEDEDKTVMVECLVCQSMHQVEADKFHGHDWCPRCQETTNHILVGQYG